VPPESSSGPGLLPAPQAAQLQGPGRPLDALGLGDALDGEAVGGVLQDAAVREQREVLEDHADLPGADGAQFAVGERGEVLAVEADMAAVGSRRPLSMRSRVDLPEPDRPMTTKIWPGSTVKEASITAAVVPSARSPSRSAPSRSLSTASSGRLPKTLYSCSASSLDDTRASRLFDHWGRRRDANS
jgi:hypothetical protein